MDGSVVEYKITHDADDFGTPDKLTRDDLLDLIRDAGFQPKERNTRYEVCASTTGRCRWPSAGPNRRPSGREHDADQPGQRHRGRAGSRGSAAGASVGRPELGAMWLYTVLRFGMFLALWGTALCWLGCTACWPR